MGFARAQRWAAVAWLLGALLGCGDGGQNEGTGGSPGSGGTNGASASSVPGLWQGGSQGIEVCFFVSGDGRSLTGTGSDCRVTGTADQAPRAYDLKVDGFGSDDAGEPCGFELAFTGDVPIDPQTMAFRVNGIEVPDSDAVLSFSGQLVGEQASGVARLDQGDSSCRVGWGASKSSVCDQAALDTCFALLQCCQSILVSPVFFESCNSVVRQCNQSACQELLDGYPRCATTDSETGVERGSAGTE